MKFKILILFFIITIFLTGCADQNKVCYKKSCFDVELAKTGNEQRKGLMFRESLDEDKGMLFIFEKEGNYPFWMKNTLIPLDIIWIDSNYTVVFINKNTQPCEDIICDSFDPQRYALYVLEINAGLADKIGLKVGDKVSFNLN